MTQPVAAPEIVERPEQGRRPDASVGFGRRLLRNPLALACITYIVILLVVAVVAPIVMPNVMTDRAGDLKAIRELPSAEHWLGTDTLGRDVLARLLVGTRVTVTGVAVAIILFLVTALPAGLVAGFRGGWIDRIVTWVGDLLFALPGIVILLVVLSVFPQNMIAAMATFGVIAAPGLMRVVRAETLVVREQLYVTAATVSGLSRSYIVVRHVLPRIAGPVIVQAAYLTGTALLVQTGLGFLNLAVAPPAPSWGAMVAEGMSVIVLQPWLIWPSGMTIAITVLVLGLLGDAVRDAATGGWSAPSTRARKERKVASVNEAASSVPQDGQDNLLSIEGLGVSFSSSTGPVRVLDDVSLSVQKGEIVGLVGESGCGKTTVAMAILGLLPGTGVIDGGRIRFNGADLASYSENDLRRVRGKQIGLVSQEPMIGLNPAFRVGWQIAETVRIHSGVSRKAAQERTLELFRMVQLPEPEDVARRYPHELSGGMAQRVSIARALSGDPDLLLADEPSTALDVTVQAEILDLLQDIRDQRNMSILLVTHDWGVIADACDRAVVMYAGQVVEQASVLSLFHKPLHPYTEALLAANPHRAGDADVLPSIPGVVPEPGSWPEGCHFHPRCAYRTDRCDVEEIAIEEMSDGRETRCIHYDQVSLTLGSTS